MKSKIIIFFITVLVIGLGFFFLGKQTRLTQVVPNSFTQNKPTSASGVDRTTFDVARETGVSLHPPIKQTIKKNTQFQNQSKDKTLSLSKINRNLQITPLIISVNGISNEIGRTGVSNFVGLLSKDLPHLEAILKKGNFELIEWNLSKWANISDPDAPITWRIYFDGPNGTIGDFRKEVFTDSTHSKELRSQGYNVTFFSGGQTIDRFARNDGSESLGCFTNGRVRGYVQRFNNMDCYGIFWNANGDLVSEKIEKPMPQVIAAKKRLVEEYKNDPNKADWVRGIQEELNRMQSNQ